MTSGIKEWSSDERPRERLFSKGARSLSDAELIALITGSGFKGTNAVDAARQALKKCGGLHLMARSDISLWMECKGLGPAKAARLKAAFELGRRINAQSQEPRPLICSPRDITAVFAGRLRGLPLEVFCVAALDGQNKLIEIVDVTEGTVNQAHPIIREIFHRAIQYGAASIICGHNHPSGDASPSPEDRRFTEALIKAGKTLHIPVLDHIIIGSGTHYSFSEQEKSYFQAVGFFN